MPYKDLFYVDKQTIAKILAFTDFQKDPQEQSNRFRSGALGGHSIKPSISQEELVEDTIYQMPDAAVHHLAGTISLDLVLQFYLHSEMISLGWLFVLLKDSQTFIF